VRGRLVLAAAALAALAGCEKTWRNMYDDARTKPLAASTAFADGRSARAAPAGTVERVSGVAAETSSGREGGQALARRLAAERAAALPDPVAPTLLQRGRERFAIYCEPCHGALGDGDGRVARRGFPRPPSYHSDRLRAAPDRHFYDVIGQGYGVMYPYGDRVAPEDRWAIVAWIRALQKAAPVAAVASSGEVNAR
jgi:mono/diheme cytochrome c family protein